MTIRVFSVGMDQYTIQMFRKRIGFEVTHRIEGADVVVFPGGADVDPSLYGERTLSCTHTYAPADARDKEAWEKSKDKLKLGICRGGQFLNVMNGGKMYQDVTGHGGTHLAIDFLTGREIPVISTHHQMMIPSPKGVLLCGAQNRSTRYVTAEYPTGVPQSLQPEYDNEVIWYEETRSLCFQPHPEYGEGPTRVYFFDLLKRIL